MTQKQRNYKKALIKSIHTSPLYNEVYKEDRELYETMLNNRYVVKSSKDLEIDQLIDLNNFLNKKESKTTLKKVTGITKNQLSFILTLWENNSMHKDMFSLLKIIKRVTKREISSIEELTKKEAGVVIASIKNMKPITAANNTNYKG